MINTFASLYKMTAFHF